MDESRSRKDDATSDYTSHRSLTIQYAGLKDSVQLRADKRVLENLLLTDPLTMLPNERSINNNAEKLFKSFKKRNGPPFAVVFMDLDNFKVAANDRYGHDAGDIVLKEFAAIINPDLHRSDDPNSLLNSPFRDEDTVGRIHGDEHVALLPNWDPDTDIGIFASNLEERLNSKLKSLLNINYPDKPGLVDVGVSLGVSVVENEDYTHKDAFSRADKVLYAVKASKHSHRRG